MGKCPICRGETETTSVYKDMKRDLQKKDEIKICDECGRKYRE